MASQSGSGTDWFTDVISCETHMKVVKLSYTWTLHDFSMRREESGKKIDSSTFSTVGPGNLKWRLELYPNGDGTESKDFVSLFLRLVCSDKDGFLADFKCAVLGEGGRKANVIEGTSRFVRNSVLGWKKFIGRDRLLKGTDCLLQHDKLVLSCEVVAFVDSVNISPPNKVAAVNVPECRLSEDFGHLLASSRLSDVMLTAEGKNIPAHKAILAARCPVFAAMFELGMREETEGRVEITDCDFQVLHQVVEFIYTGRAPKLNEMAEQVLVVANKYDLGRLKAMCEDVLCSRLSVETAAETLGLADMHNAAQLKTNALLFIKANGASVVQTVGWNTIASQSPHLAVEAFCSLVVKTVAPKTGRGHK